jgi:hypothetical protein
LNPNSFISPFSPPPFLRSTQNSFPPTTTAIRVQEGFDNFDDDHGGEPHPMQHDRGFPGSHWTPLSGEHLCCIAWAAAMTINGVTISCD